MAEKIDITINASDQASSALNSIKGTLSSMGGVALRAGAVIGTALVALWSVGLKSAAQIEQTSVAFKTMLKDGARAKLLMGELSRFAEETPFEFPEIADAGKKLLAFGFEAKDIQANLRRLGDVASGLNIPLGELSEIYGKARVQWRLFAEDVNQLTGRGIPITKALADTMGVAQEEIRGMVEKGKIGFPELEKAMKSLTEQWGQFEGGMAAQAKTVNGLASTINDKLLNVLRESIGMMNDGTIVEGGIFDRVRQSMAWLIMWLDANKTSIQGALQAISNAFSVAFSIIGSILSVFTGSTGSEFSGLFTYLQALVSSHLAILQGFWQKYGADILVVLDFAFSVIKENFRVVFGVLVYLSNVFGGDLKRIFKSGFTIIWEVFKAFSSLLKGDWSALWESIKTIVKTVFWQIQSGMNIAVDVIYTILRGFGAGIAGIWQGIKTVAVGAWNGIYSTIIGVFNRIVEGAKSWGGNMIQALVDSIKQKLAVFKDTILGVATTIQDYLGFYSPAKKWPGADAGKWMPNLIDMLATGISDGESKIENVAHKIASSLARSLTPEQNNQFAEKIKQIASQAQSAFEQLQGKIDTQKSKVSGLKDDYGALKTKLKEVGEEGSKSLAKISDQLEENARKISGIKTGGQSDVAKRALDLESQISEARKESPGTNPEEEAKRQAKISAMESELALAKQFAGSTALDAQRVENAKSETQLIIDRVAQKTLEAQTERLEIQKSYDEKKMAIEKEKADIVAQMEAKKIAIKSEQDAYKLLVRQRMMIDQSYFDAFGVQLKKQVDEIQQAIWLTRALSSLGRTGITTTPSIAWARANGGPVASGSTYLVGERWPELFTPNRSGTIIPNGASGGQTNNISINLGGVSVKNDADINQLTDKIALALTRKLELYRLGIA